VLASGHKGRGFEPGRGDENSQHTFLRMGSKAAGPMSYDSTACQRSLEVFQILIGKILTASSIPRTCPRCLLLVDSRRALVDESRAIPSQNYHHHASSYSHITRGMNDRLVAGRSSET
jgi:hypothetical protein